MSFIVQSIIAAVQSSSAAIDRSITPTQPGTSQSAQKAGVFDPFSGGPAVGADPDLLASSRTVYISKTQYTDYRFRFWAIPEELRLSSPTINTDIPFLIWNTHPEQQALTSLTVSGSNVLSFDVSLNDVFRDHELATINMQIGPGEPNIDALVSFSFTDGIVALPVIATVSETFNLVPDVPVQETWEYLTDIITNHNGQEQRIALRKNPRRSMQFRVDILDLEDRQKQYTLLFKNFGLQAIIPAYHHATQITQTTPIGGSKLFFDPELTQMRVGESIVAINPETEDANIASVTALEPDGAIIGSTVGEEITPAWYVYPAHAMILRDGSGIEMQQVSGKMNIRADGFSSPSVPRPDAIVLIQQLDGINIMDRRPLISADENFSYRLERLDFETGVIDLQRLGDPHPRIEGARRWKVSRYDTKTRDEDFFREFIDDCRGAHKAWLLPTWFPDLTYNSGASELSGVIAVNELNYADLFHKHETWQRIMIEYDNDLPPSFHNVQSATVNAEGTVTNLSLNPVLDDDPRVSQIKTISFLLKVRGSDTIRRAHYALDTFYTWSFKTVDD